MPELPEVEVTRRRISPLLLSRVIQKVDTTSPSYFFLTAPGTLKKKLQGRYFTALVRHGKYLIGHLDDSSRVLMHLGMTGQLFGAGAANPRLLRRTAQGSLDASTEKSFQPDVHTHLSFHFANGPSVYFRDTRKFGKVEWLKPDQESPRLNKLGRDALEITAAELHQVLARRKGPIKCQLLDQSILAGAGNIYADEALFLAGIRPTRTANRLTLAACEQLVARLKQVLLRSIETGGSSISDYVAPDGSDGGYQDERHVYGLADTECRVCETHIKRIVLGQRSAHYCPNCQR